jgi:biopolymer transport protein ExbD
MAKGKGRKNAEGCPLDMTPMIDVVFQLIIFFIVTITMEAESNPDIELAEAVHGPVIEDLAPQTTVIEVDRRGWISMHNVQLSKQNLRSMMKSKYRRYGEFPILIRADYRTRHEDVREVMDICAESGIWRIDFAAIQERAP